MTENGEAHGTTRCRFSPGRPEPLTDRLQRIYLVDLACEPATLEQLYQSERDPAFRLVYAETRYHDLARSGPVLIVPAAPKSRHWLEHWFHAGRALSLDGETRAIEDLVAHFQGLSQARLSDRLALFRHADPGTIASLGESLSHRQCARLLGPLTRIQGVYENRHWHITGPVQSPHTESAPFTLTPENEAKLKQVREQRMAQALAQTFKLPFNLVETWLRQLQSTGATSEIFLTGAFRRLAQRPPGGPMDERQLQQLWQQSDRADGS